MEASRGPLLHRSGSTDSSITQEVALRPLDLRGPGAAIADHTAATIQPRITRAARDLAGIHALLRERLDVFCAVAEEVNVEGRDIDAARRLAKPLPDLLHRLLLHTVPLSEHIGRVDIGAI